MVSTAQESGFAEEGRAEVHIGPPPVLGCRRCQDTDAAEQQGPGNPSREIHPTVIEENIAGWTLLSIQKSKRRGVRFVST